MWVIGFREQAPDLVDGQRDQAGLAAAVPFTLPCGDDGQDGAREHDQVV
jgi:hypothetical protein